MSGNRGDMAAVREHFRNQALACDRLGSRYNARLLALAADRLDEAAEPDRRILDWPGDPAADALALRWTGALHALVLEGRSPSMVDIDDDEALWQAVRVLMAAHESFIGTFLDHPPQTNEVARSAALMPGFQVIHAQTGRPLRLLELGSSAGLNRLWQHWRYEAGQWSHGNRSARVTLQVDWQGGRPPLADPVVLSSRGVDIRPVDIMDHDQRLRLRSYIWPDQPLRLRRLDGAIAQAADSGMSVEQGDAADWLEARLAEDPDDGVTVIFHSIVWQYLPPSVRRRCRAAIEGAGESGRSVAWLRMEPDESASHAVLHLDLWPKRRHFHLADCHFHGAWVRWHGERGPGGNRI